MTMTTDMTPGGASLAQIKKGNDELKRRLGSAARIAMVVDEITAAITAEKVAPGYGPIAAEDAAIAIAVLSRLTLIALDGQ